MSLLLTSFPGVVPEAKAFRLDNGRGVWTIAPILEKAKLSVVRIQLGSSRWSKGKAGPGGIGTGFVVDARRGLILTNRHVVKGARRIYALTSNKRSYRARVLGTDRRVDLAVLQIKANNLSELTIGNSETIKIGDMNIVVGFPFGLAMSSSIGIISAGGGKIRGRYREDGHSLQTDAAINPGNSGGPFLNSKGEVVGVNTSILGDNGGTSLGIGFGIPINVAVRTMNRILQNNRMAKVSQDRQTSRVASADTGNRTMNVAVSASRSSSASHNPKLGLTLQTLTSGQGVLVKKVDAGSSGKLAGLQSGDTIMRIGNATISSSEQLVKQIYGRHNSKSKSKVKVIFRRGQYDYETFLQVVVLAG